MAIEPLDRTDLASILDPREVGGMLRMSSFDCVVPLTPDDQRAVASITASALASLGLGRSDRVVVAASSDAAPLAEAASLVSSAVAHVEPQGRQQPSQLLKHRRPRIGHQPGRTPQQSAS